MNQLSLFPVDEYQGKAKFNPMPVDKYWDEITEDDTVREQVTTDTDNTSNPDSTVREQVKPDTSKSAPEHTQWTEKYYVSRYSKRYYYYRYCWMEGRKIHHRHIGSVGSTKAREKYQKVVDAIALGKCPVEIKDLLSHITVT